jgi:SLT domain-containing protein
MGVATSVISGGITGGLTNAFPSIFAKAKGGIVGQMGDIPLHKYARGGIANSPQIAMFGEGRKNEAYVPLPDNRTIPVTLSGGGGASITNGDTIVTVKINNSESGSSSTVDVEQSKKFSVSMAAAVKATVQEELIKQMRPRGLLNA